VTGAATVSTAVVLAGGRGSAVLPLANYYPKLIFPIGHAPLISHLLTYLQRQGITNVAVLSSAHHDLARQKITACEKLKGDSPMRLSWFTDDGTKGSAGALKQAEAFVGDDDFVVVQANLFVHEMDLSEVAATHHARKSGVTVVVERRGSAGPETEHIETDAQGRVTHVRHSSAGADRGLAFSGLYLFSPRVLKTFDDDGYCDIKEQLLPLLYEANIPVHTFQTGGVISRMNTLGDYFRINGEYLFNGVDRPSPFFPPKEEMLPRVWVGRNVRISPSAHVVGPVLIGDDCVIEDKAQIIGPATIGRGGHVEQGAQIRESIVWQGSRLRRSSRVEFSLVVDDCVVPAYELHSNTIVVNSDALDGRLKFMISMTPQRVAPVRGAVADRPAWARQRISVLSAVVKRSLDLVLSGLGLLVSFPLLAVIALAVKLTSAGPIFFRQVRCGRNARPFRMYKFRTMVQDAEHLKEQLAARNEADGPMFKLTADPRVTPIGRFLRKTSLDELPQLLNVLHGEMSLVGPRPLALEEMKFSPTWRDIRLSVKPGITGLWQVKGRASTKFHDWIEYDVDYALNRSFALDLKLLIQTVWVALRGNGAK